MKCISIQQPWASLILDGHKAVENRSWECLFRGTVLVHAGKKLDKDALEWLAVEGFTEDKLKLEMGCILGTVDIIGCDRKDTGDKWECWGQFHWRLANPRRFSTPIPYRGALGIFLVPDSVVNDALREVRP